MNHAGLQEPEPELDSSSGGLPDDLTEESVYARVADVRHRLYDSPGRAHSAEDDPSRPRRQTPRRGKHRRSLDELGGPTAATPAGVVPISPDGPPQTPFEPIVISAAADQTTASAEQAAAIEPVAQHLAPAEPADVPTAPREGPTPGGRVDAAEAARLAELIAEADRLTQRLQSRIEDAERAISAARAAEAPGATHRIADKDAAASRAVEAAQEAQRCAEGAVAAADAAKLAQRAQVSFTDATEATQRDAVEQRAGQTRLDDLAARADELTAGLRLNDAVDTAAEQWVEPISETPDAAQIAEWDRLAAQRLAEYNQRVAEERLAREAGVALQAQRSRAARTEPDPDQDQDQDPAPDLDAAPQPNRTLGMRLAHVPRKLDTVSENARMVAEVRQPFIEAGPAGSASAADGPSPARRRIGRRVRTVTILALAAIGAGALLTYVGGGVEVPLDSMQYQPHPCTGCNTALVLVDKVDYRIKSLQRDDLVVYRRSSVAPGEGNDLVGRIIAMPGQTVQARGGHVYVNGAVLEEPYLDLRCSATPSFRAVTVPANEYFVLGDNRCAAAKSRSFGAVARDSVVGRAVAVLWPRSRWHLF